MSKLYGFANTNDTKKLNKIDSYFKLEEFGFFFEDEPPAFSKWNFKLYAFYQSPYYPVPSRLWPLQVLLKYCYFCYEIFRRFTHFLFNQSYEGVNYTHSLNISETHVWIRSTYLLAVCRHESQLASSFSSFSTLQGL